MVDKCSDLSMKCTSQAIVQGLLHLMKMYIHLSKYVNEGCCLNTIKMCNHVYRDLSQILPRRDVIAYCISEL